MRVKVMKSFGLGVSVLAIALGASAVAVAQDQGAAPPFPVLNDLADGWEMGGKPVPLDVLGITIGMPRETAQTKAAEGLGAQPSDNALAEEETGISGEYGIAVYYRFPWLYQVSSTSPNGSGDSLVIHFTTGISGERVSGLEREIVWSEADAPRMPDLIASLSEKYGEPSYGDLAKAVGNRAGGSAFWVYHKGEKATLPAEGNWAAKRTRDGSATACVFDGLTRKYFYEPEPVNPGMGPKRERLMERKDCSIVLLVIVRESNVPGIAKSMKIEMGGLSRQYENFMATDAFLDGELKKKMEGETPPESKAPKL